MNLALALPHRLAADQTRTIAVPKWEGGLLKWPPPLRRWGVGGQKKDPPSFGKSSGSLRISDLTIRNQAVGGTEGVALSATAKRSASSAASAFAPGTFTLAAALMEL